MARIRPKSRYAKPDAPIRQLILRGRAGLRRDLRAVLRHQRDVFNKRRALHLLRHGNAGAIYREAIDWKHYREVLKAVFDRWAKIYEEAAQLGERKINGAHYRRGRRVHYQKQYMPQTTADWQRAIEATEHWYQLERNVKIDEAMGRVHVSKAIGDRFDFDRFDDDTQAKLREAQDDLIKQLTEDARDTIEQAILNGQRQGLAPEDIVDDIWEVIGLTDTQAQAVLNYENMLRDLDPDALKRQLRDADYDRVLMQALDSDTPLNEAVISEMVDAYEENYYDYRAKTIAMTESNRAGHQGLADSYRQAVDRGALSEEAVTRHWLLGDNPCPICESIADNNEEGVGINELFDSDEGPVDNPPVHPHCECDVEYITDLSLVPEDNEEE